MFNFSYYCVQSLKGSCYSCQFCFLWDLFFFPDEVLMLKITSGFALPRLEVLLIFMLELFPVKVFDLFEVLVLSCEVVLFAFFINFL